MTNLQVINDQHCRTCCGPVRYLLDQCNGTVPWKCYWTAKYPYSGTKTRPDSTWSMDGNRMRPPLHAGTLDEYGGIMFKLKSYPPPWTVEYVMKIEGLGWRYSSSTSTEKLFWFESQLNSGKTKCWIGQSSDRYDDWIHSPGALGVISPDKSHAYALGAFDHNNPNFELYYKLSMDINNGLVYDMKLNGVTAAFEPNYPAGEDPWLPGERIEMTADNVQSMWTDQPWWPISFICRYDGWYQYIEARSYQP